FAEDLGKNYFVLFQIRGGKLLSSERFVSEGEDSPVEVMEAFLRDYYALAADIPREVMVSVEVEEPKILEDYIRSFTDHAVNLIHPKAGVKDDLVMLAIQNARAFATASRVAWESAERKAELALGELKKILNLKSLKRIEGYDISHLFGTETIGSMVVFKNGLANKADYRQFRLRSTASKNDDYASLEEVLTRRLNHLPDPLPEGYKIRKAKKKDMAFIGKTAKKNPLNREDYRPEQFHILEKNKKIVGFCRTRPLSDTVHDISVLWIDPKERGHKFGYHLMKKCIEHSRQKRLYMSLSQDLKDYHLAFGWVEIAQAPKPLIGKVERAGKTGIDISDNIYMAYQKKKRDLSFESRPDLMVIDGGKGQLGVVVKVLQGKNLDIPVLSLAKEKEEVFVPRQADAINLKSTSEASYLLQRLRDEAHRFAITASRGSRDKKMTQSAIDDIPGVGSKLKKRLLMHFGSAAAVRAATKDQIAAVAGPLAAQSIKENL
ncbi:MAG: GNAT family N-acetyltransferase, partial [Candidatus Peregrinibacteria bacterium]